MAEDAPTQLTLLAPWELPIEQPLRGAQRAKVQQALQLFLQALWQPVLEAIELTDRAIATVGSFEISPIQIASTKTPLKQEQIEDFDQYFRAYHVQTTDPVLCLIRSILVSYRQLLDLYLHDHLFDPVEVDCQRQGYISYVHLLARVFALDLEDLHD